MAKIQGEQAGWADETKQGRDGGGGGPQVQEVARFNWPPRGAKGAKNSDHGDLSF